MYSFLKYYDKISTPVENLGLVCNIMCSSLTQALGSLPGAVNTKNNNNNSDDNKE